MRLKHAALLAILSDAVLPPATAATDPTGVAGLIAAAAEFAGTSGRRCLYDRVRDLDRRHELEPLNKVIADFADAGLRRRLTDIAYRVLMEDGARPLSTGEKAWLERRGFRLIGDRSSEATHAGCDLVITIAEPIHDGNYAIASVAYSKPGRPGSNATTPLFLKKKRDNWRILIAAEGFTIVS